MDTLSKISSDLADGMSVFYAIMYDCAHTLGYLPEDKFLSAENFELADELHEERNLACQWLICNAVKIKNSIVPDLVELCGEFVQYHNLLDSKKTISNDAIIKSLESLCSVVNDIFTENDRLRLWLKKINSLHQKVLSRCTYNPEPGAYSWQDASHKLETTAEFGTKMNVSWEGVLNLVNGAVKDLEKAKISPAQIVKSMFAQAAAKQWDDIVETAKKMIAIEIKPLMK